MGREIDRAIDEIRWQRILRIIWITHFGAAGLSLTTSNRHTGEDFPPPDMRLSCTPLLLLGPPLIGFE